MSAYPALEAFGWNDAFARHFAAFDAEQFMPGRVVLEYRRLWRVRTEDGEVLARPAGRLRHRAETPDQFPAVGDWVVLPREHGRNAIVRAVLPRRSKFSRKAPGETTEEQVVAANIDTVFLAQSLDRDFNPRRLERYLVLAWESGARPVILLNKADIADDLRAPLHEAEAVAAGVPVHVLSARLGTGLEALVPYLKRATTVALLGSSGVGKSTLINRLAGRDIQLTRDLHVHGRGRHTTTNRQLFVLPNGALVIDTPGLREIQLWGGGSPGDSLQAIFPEIEELGAGCHFRDCRHESEPKCAVRAAVDEGRLPAGRLESYVKLRAESQYLAGRQDQLAQAATKRKWRIIHRAARNFKPRG